MPTLGKTKVSPNLISTGSLFLGTSSYAITASYAANAGSGGSGGGSTSLTGITFPYVSGSNVYTLSQSAVAANDLLLSVNGVVQTPTTDYTVSASSVTFTDSYPSGSSVNVRYLVTATSSSFVDLNNIVLTGTTTGDAYYPQVAALLHFDGVNGSTTITDNSKNNFTITATNGAVISTAQSKFGGASVFLDGTNDYLVTPTTSAFTFGTGDFTVELWIYQTVSSVSAYKVLVGDNVYGSVGGWQLYSYNNQLNLWKGGTEIISPSGTLTLNSWNHIVWTRASGNNRIFINGTQVGSTVSDSTNYTSTAIYIGAAKDGYGYYAGYIDEIRITKGVARYTGNFTPQTSAFPNNTGVTQYATKYVGLIGGLNDKSVDYGVQKLSDTSLKVVKMTQTTSPFPSGSLSSSVDRVYVNVLDYNKVNVTSSYATNALTASYASNSAGGVTSGKVFAMTLLFS